MTLTDMLTDSAMIGRLSDADFAEYWTALGKAIRVVCQASHTPPPAPARAEINTTSATTERAWQPAQQQPARVVGFTTPGEH